MLREGGNKEMCEERTKQKEKCRVLREHWAKTGADRDSAGGKMSKGWEMKAEEGMEKQPRRS